MPDPRTLLRALFDAAVARASPERCLAGFLPAPPLGRMIVVGAGKAAAAMAKAVEHHFRDQIPGVDIRGLVVTRYGHGVPTDHIEVVEAGHPVPDAAGYAAAERMLKLVKGLSPEDLVLCLLSGGASALLTIPDSPLTLRDKQAVTRELLRSGATIAEMNCVRKHMSAIKGGRLAAACHPASVLTLAISDVPGDDPAVIGSGPTVANPTTFGQALEVLERYRIAAPAPVREYFAAGSVAAGGAETPKPGDPRLSRARTQIVATAKQSLAVAAEVASRAGVVPILLGDDLEGEARTVANQQAQRTKEVIRDRSPTAPPCVLLSGGETTITVRGRGRGGRNQEFLLALALALDSEPQVYALAADTDGIDGTENVAGAMIAPDTLLRAAARGLDARQSLAENDSYRFFDGLGDVIVTGPTLTNVNDFRAILIGWRD